MKLLASSVLGLLFVLTLPHADAEPSAPARVSLLRVPKRGIQPQVAVADDGAVHMIYFHGRPAAGDVFYVRSTDGGNTFTAPIQVNGKSGSAIAIGNIRGAQLALGKNGRVHVAWMGSSKAEPKAPGGESPMLYTRLDDAGAAFEPERNVITSAVGLDGGGSVAADILGNVYVVWHAAEPNTKGESNRRVWVARSTDEGKTFAPEKPAYAGTTGACGCCGMRAFADRSGHVHVLYRSASEQVHRDIYLLTSTDHASAFQGLDLHPWQINACPMSSMAFAESDSGVLAAWETRGQVYWSRIDAALGKPSDPIAAPGTPRGRKHPVVAGNNRGETLLAWTEGMGWDEGGSLAWQVFDKSGKPTTEKGQAPGVPVWSLVAVFTRPDGRFTVVY
jgi:hypothetical protein